METPMEVQDWKDLVRSIRKTPKTRLIAPESETQLGFGLRQDTSGLITSEIQAELEAALQLLYIVDPNVATSLAGDDVDNPWRVDADHPADKLVAKEPLINNDYMLQAWTALTHNNHFVGKFGVFINHKHTNEIGTSSLVAYPDIPGLWEVSGTFKAHDWHEFFDSCFGPVKITLPSNATVVSAQSSISSSEDLPSFLTVNAFPGRVPSQLFPPETYPIFMRTMNDELIQTTVKWVGGVYTMTMDERQRLVTIFDWADGSDYLGSSLFDHWNTDLPTKRERDAFTRLCATHMALPLLMVFRRV